MNKGEWSEFYAFLRLLADGKLYAADLDLNKIEDLYYPIIKIIRQSKNYKKPLFYDLCDKQIIIINSENSQELCKISSEDFKINADKLFKIIKEASSSFDAPEIENFVLDIGSPLVKERSSSKRDITLVVHDINTGYKPEIGFSIKSRLGGASTLFNANLSSNLKFIVTGLNDLECDKRDKLSALKAKALLKALYENECEIIFDSVVDSHFESNLEMIDSKFPIILAEILKLYYSGFSDKISDLCQQVARLNPCGFKNNTTFPFYEHKIKGFLTACALGLTSKKPWEGDFDVSGGYIVVKEDGEVLCYHIYNWNIFQEYLFYNTYIDTPSTSRHKHGRLDGNNLNLNFQIRFK